MQAFVKLEERLLRQMRILPYRLSAQASLESFAATMATELSTVDLDLDTVFISLDFEGALDDKGINEFGLAKLDTLSILSAITVPPSTPRTLH